MVSCLFLLANESISFQRLNPDELISYWDTSFFSSLALTLSCVILSTNHLIWNFLIMQRDNGKGNGKLPVHTVSATACIVWWITLLNDYEFIYLDTGAFIFIVAGWSSHSASFASVSGYAHFHRLISVILLPTLHYITLKNDILLFF